MLLNIPKKTFDPHPIGRHTGVIANVQDEGMQESPWGEQHKISVRIDSDSAYEENGDPHSVVSWYSLSSASKSNLRKFREAVLDRILTPEEENCFDPENELVGKRISYRVDHREKQDGGTRAVIREGSVEPAGGKAAQPPSAAEPELVSVAGDGSNGGSPTQTPTEGDLPFS